MNKEIRLGKYDFKNKPRCAALIIGIDDYSSHPTLKNTQKKKLSSPEYDIKEMEKFLQ